MNEADVIAICREAIIVMLKVAGPILLLGLAIGVLVSMLQIITQIQEAALTFVPKVVIIFGATLLLMPFMLTTLSDFTHHLAERIITIDKAG